MPISLGIYILVALVWRICDVIALQIEHIWWHISKQEHAVFHRRNSVV